MLLKILPITLLLFLAACTNPETYQPSLASKPKNDDKYQSDLAECKEWAKPTPTEVMSLIAFGGLADVAMAAGGNTRMLKSETANIDDCLHKRGYVLQSD